jgi:ribulose-bisphosphate carboxylase large chain
MNERIRARYRIETCLAPEAAAAAMAGEQSSGTFIAVPGETPELRAQVAARVETVHVTGERSTPSLPGALRGPLYHEATVELSWSLDNTGTNLPTVMSTVAGNLFELKQLSGCRLLEVHLPEAFAKAYAGPQFGVSGTRQLAGVHGRPLIGTIVKPSVGLSPQQTAELARNLARAGIDVIKDDELMANPPHSPLRERVAAVMAALHEVAQETGRLAMYAFNISDDIDAMLSHHEVVAKAGGTCVMVSLNSVGLSGVAHLRRHCSLPIHGHRNGWGMLSRHPLLGLDFSAYQLFWRLAGVDHLHVNGLANKFCETDDSVVASMTALHCPFHHHLAPMPVVSSGQWGGQAPATYQRTATLDLMYLAGGGVMAHPDGPAAGLLAIRQAWEAAVAGIDLTTYASTRPALRTQLATFTTRQHAQRA